MTKYIKRFELTSQYEEYINSDMAILPNVSLTNDDNMVYYNPGPNYLNFTAEEDNSTISLNAGTSPDIKYSLNWGEWTQWDYSDITLNHGDTVRIKGNNSNGFSMSNSSFNQFRMIGKIGASGNIMSLLYEDEFEGKLTIPCAYCFYNMFYNCKSLTTAPELPATTFKPYCYRGMFRFCSALTTVTDLPATTLAIYCYFVMFQGCSALTTIYELPATILAGNCYNCMFWGCSSLTIAPELPATTLAPYCYNSMFYGCKSLTNTPELSATILATGCYYHMFADCTKLNYIKMLATDISSNECLSAWVNNVSSTGTFVKDPNMTSLPTGASGIPTGWTVQDAA